MSAEQYQATDTTTPHHNSQHNMRPLTEDETKAVFESESAVMRQLVAAPMVLLDHLPRCLPPPPLHFEPQLT